MSRKSQIQKDTKGKSFFFIILSRSPVSLRGTQQAQTFSGQSTQEAILVGRTWVYCVLLWGDPFCLGFKGHRKRIPATFHSGPYFIGYFKAVATGSPSMQPQVIRSGRHFPSSAAWSSRRPKRTCWRSVTLLAAAPRRSSGHNIYIYIYMICVYVCTYRICICGI